MTTYALLHGFMGSTDSWSAVAEHLKSGPERFSSQTVALEIFGHGYWGEGKTMEPTTFEEEVARLAAQIRELPPPVHLVGYSMGARLALGILLEKPELALRGPVGFLTLIGVNPGLDDDQVRAERAAADEVWAQKLEQDFGSFLEEWRKQPVFEGLEQRADLRTLEADAAARARLDPAGLAMALRCLGLGKMPSYKKALADLELPVSIVVGEHDEKFWDLARPMASSLPMATIHVVPKAGHNVILEVPHSLEKILVPLRSTTLTELDSRTLRLGEIKQEVERRSRSDKS